MKRFLLFSGATYYPGGGTDDLVGAFDTVDEAKDAWNTLHDWASILDTQTGEIRTSLGDGWNLTTVEEQINANHQ